MNLQEQLQALADQDPEAFSEALANVTVQPFDGGAGNPNNCPRGYKWNGTACVLDVG